MRESTSHAGCSEENKQNGKSESPDAADCPLSAPHRPPGFHTMHSGAPGKMMDRVRLLRFRTQHQ